MSAPGSQPQTNGVQPSASQPPNSTQPATSSQSQQTTQPTTAATQSQPQSQPAQPTTAAQQIQQQQQQLPTSPSTSTPRPRDARTLELLLTAQGVTATEQRVPLLLLDFAYRHTQAVLSDALQLSGEPYVSHAGAKASAASGAVPVNVGDASVSANAIQLAIGSRLNFQFRGGSGGGGASKEWMMELAKERNKVALPRPGAHEWGARLPGERFVLNGLSFGLREVWAGQVEEYSDEDDEMEFEDAMGGDAGKGDAMEIEKEEGGDEVEGGTIDDVFGDDLEDEEMAEV